MLNHIPDNRTCMIAENWVYNLIIGFTIASLAMFAIISATEMMDIGISVVPFWYLGLFVSIGLVLTISLGVVLWCITRWSRML